MKQIIKIVCSWKGLIFLISTLLVLSLYGLPHALYHFEAPNPSWMAFSGPPDEEYFLTMVEEVYMGRTDLVNPFLAGYDKYKGSPILPLPIYLTGWFQRILHITPKSLVLLLNLIMPLAAFYLIFVLGKRIGLGYKASILASFMALSTPFLFLAEPSISSRIFLLPKKHLLDFFLPMSRLINPQIGIIFFIGTLALWVDYRRSLWRTVACLALSALCMASNFFMGTSLMAFWSAELVIGRVLRNKPRNLAASFIAIAITCTPLIVQSREIGRLRKIFPDIFMLDLQLTRLPLLTTGEGIAVIFLALHILIRRALFYENFRDRFVVLSVASYLISMNQQIVTGRMVQSWHYECYVFNLLLPIVAAAVGAEWRETKSFLAVDRLLGKKIQSAVFFCAGILICAVSLAGEGRIYPVAPWGIEELANLYQVFSIIVGGLCFISAYILLFVKKGAIKLSPLLFVVLMVFSFTDGIVEQLYGYESQKIWQIDMEREYIEPFQWINHNLTPSNVFLGYPVRFCATSVIPIYTSQKVFISSNSIVHPVPGLPDSQKRLFILFALTGISDNELKEQLKTKELLIRLFFHKKVYLNSSWQSMIFDPSRIPPPTDQEISDAVSRYKPYTNYTPEELFRLGQIDYLYWGPTERYYFQTIDPNKLEFLEKVFSNDNVEIYRVKR